MSGLRPQAVIGGSSSHSRPLSRRRHFYFTIFRPVNPLKPVSFLLNLYEDSQYFRNNFKFCKQCQVPPLCDMLVGERPPQAPSFTHGVPCGCAFLRNTFIRTGHAGEKDHDPAAARCPKSGARFPGRSKACAFPSDPVCNRHRAHSFPIAGFHIPH